MGIAELPEREPSEQASVPARTDGSSRRVALTTLALTLTNGLSVLWKTQATHRGVTAAGFALSLAPDRKGDSLFAALMSHGTESASPPPPSPSATWSAADTATVGVSAAGAITNTGEVSLPWSFASQANLTITPSAGTLAAGGTQPLSIVAAAAATYVMTLVSAGASITGNDQTMVATVAAVAPTSATLSGSSSATTGVAHTSTVTLDHPADQAYTITWSRTGGATGVSTSTITTGQTAVSADDTWATAGSGSVDFTISPSLTRSGRPLSVTIADPAAPGALPSITLAPAVSGTLPFAFGHAFRQGDVPAGQVANAASATDWQCTPMTYWPDGSLKHAIIAGRAAVTSGVDLALALTAGAAAGGAALTEANLASALPATTIAVDADTTDLNALIGTAALHTTVCTGPVMSSWVYRRPVSGNNHLVVFAEVRLFKGGEVEIFPWVENGYLSVASPSNFVKTCTVTIGGVSRFSQSIDIKHHTRIPLLSGTSYSYWVGSDPGITPKHDKAYFAKTKLIPNLGAMGAPDSASLNALVQSYTPNTLAGDTNATGSSGGGGAMVSAPAAAYVTSGGDARAYKAMMTHGLSAGSWAWHYRDESTNLPISYASYPNISLIVASTPTIPTATGGSNSSGGPAVTHTPSYAYLPFLVTGRWWFLEELHFMATFYFMWNTPGSRDGSNGVADSNQYTVRGLAWALNAIGQAAAVTPTSHPRQAQFVASWQYSMERLYGKYVTGSLSGGAWANSLGLVGSYSSDGETLYGPGSGVSGAWWDGAWQHNYVACVLGYTSDLGIPQSAGSLSNHVAVRNHSYKLVVGRADDGYFGRYNWRRFIAYGLPIGTDSHGLPVDAHYTTHGQCYAELEAGYSLTTLDPAFGGSLKQHTSDTDLTSSDSSRQYGSTAVCALAMAVDHEAPGANEGWDRVSNASNFATGFTDFMANTNPEWSVAPRPVESITIPAAGTVGNLGTATLNSIVGRVVNWWSAWSGIAWLPWWGRAGSLAAAGGGHGDGDQNDMARQDIATGAGSMIKSPYATSYWKPPSSNNAENNTGDGWMWANATLGDTTMQTGESPSQHHYGGGLLAVPNNAIPSLNATYGILVNACQSAIPYNGNFGSKAMHVLRVGVDQQHTLYGPSAGSLNWHRGNNGTSHDRKRNRVWFSANLGSDPSLKYAYRDLADGSESTLTFALNGGMSEWNNSYDSQEWSSRHDLIIRLMETGAAGTANFSKLIVLDPATGQAYQPTQTGTPPAATGLFAACWSDVWNAIAMIRATGSDNNVYFLKPTGNPRTQAWAWTAHAVTSGTIRAAQGGWPAFNRLRHATSLGNVLLWAADSGYPVQLIGVTPP